MREYATNTSKRGRIKAKRKRTVLFVYCSPPATILFLLWQFDFCHAFASYLLSKSNCWTELSTDEVIMNHAVVAAAESDDPHMQIQVVQIDGSNTVFTIVDHRIAVPSFPITVPLRLATSDDSPTNPDFQWAMDVLEQNGENGASDQRSTFVNGGCEAKNRVAGRGAKEYVQVIVAQPGATVVAAWATSHEAVRLTPAIEFVLMENRNERIEEKTNPETGPDNPVRLEKHDVRGADIDEANGEVGNSETGPEDLWVHGEELKDSVPENKNIKPASDPQKRVDELMRNSVDGLKAQIERHKKDRSRAAESISRVEMEHKRKFEEEHDGAKDRIMRDRYPDAMDAGGNRGIAKKKPLLQYEIGFDVHERLSVGSYFQGALMMIVGTAGMIQLCLCASRRGNKGRLDL